jgi:hypothetical protein
MQGVRTIGLDIVSVCLHAGRCPAAPRARGIEPTMDGLKDRDSAIELYPRVGTRPGIRTPNIFVLSEAPLPVGPAARIGAPGRGRTSNLPVRGRVHGPSCCGRVVVTPEGFEPSAFRLEGGSAVQSAGPELAGHRGGLSSGRGPCRRGRPRDRLRRAGPASSARSRR